MPPEEVFESCPLEVGFHNPIVVIAESQGPANRFESASIIGRFDLTLMYRLLSCNSANGWIICLINLGIIADESIFFLDKK